MFLYQPRDVVLVPFAYKENNKWKVKKRPGVILKEGEVMTYAIIQVTGTNRSHQDEGIWVKMDSELGILMNLRKDSFINLSVIKEFNESEIIHYIGWVDQDCMDKIELILSRM